VQGDVEEGGELHGVDCDWFIAKCAEGCKATANIEWEGGEP
jgi:hypothetical protein